MEPNSWSASQPLSVANAAIEFAGTFGVSIVPATRTVAFDDPVSPPSAVISQVWITLMSPKRSVNCDIDTGVGIVLYGGVALPAVNVPCPAALNAVWTVAIG